MQARRRAVALAVLIALAVAACSGADSGTAQDDEEADEQPQPGGSFTALFAPPATLDPIGVSASSATQAPITAVYDSLIRVDAEGEVEGRLADSMDTTDAKIWTLKLKPNLKFSDGTPLDMAAVKFNWDRQAQPGSLGRAAVSQIETSEVVDATTMRITLKEVNSQFHRELMSHLGYIGSPTAIRAKGDAFKLEPVGAGPFVVVQNIQGDRMTLKKNPNYWDAPRPYLDELVFRSGGDTSQATATLLGGQADLLSIVIVSPEVQQLEDAGYEIHEVPLFGGTGLGINTQAGALRDVRVRQALAAAIDLEDVLDKATAGAGEPVTTLFPEGHPFYDANIKQKTNDKARAQRLINEYFAETGQDANLVIMGPTEGTLGIISQAIQQHVSQIRHMSITLEPITDSATRIANNDFTMTAASINGLDPEPIMFNRLHSKSPNSLGRFADPALDAALERGRRSLDVDERKAAYQEAGRIVVDKVPFLWIYRTRYMTVVGKNIRGVELWNTGTVDFATLWRKP